MATHEQAHRDIREYLETRHDMSPEERETKFRILAEKYFGKADPATLAFRQRCQELGVRVVFPYPDDMPYEDIIKILEAPETQRALKNPQNWDF